MFWPDQAFRDLLVCLVIFGIMLALVLFVGHGNPLENPPVEKDGEPSLYQRVAKAGQYGYGANLDAPAEPAADYPARPEWYFLFLFQLLKYFKGDQEILGTVVIPNGAFLLLFLLPLLGFGRMRKFGHFFGVFVVVALLLGAGLLTFLAVADDHADEDWAQSTAGHLWSSQELEEKQQKARNERKKFAEAHVDAERAVNLAVVGIPSAGARDLLRKDPRTRGRALYEQHCAICHKLTVPKDAGYEGFTKGEFKAADLGDFAGEAWIRGLLENPAEPKYFGLTSLDGMIGWRERIEKLREIWKNDGEDVYKTKVAEQEAMFDTIAKWLSEQRKPADERDQKLDALGREQWAKRGEGAWGCRSCHTVDDVGSSSGPDLTNYGSADWIRLMVMSPAHELRHAANNEMPAFRNLDGPGAEVHKDEFEALHPGLGVIHLSDLDRELIIRFLTGDHRVVFGGEPIAK